MKPHFPILDGLRGTAALMVVVFHLFEAKFIDYSIHPIHHGYLAVDFFFLLSGFVVGYAYDDRWGKMTVKDFFKIRLIRLHPLVILSILIGGIAFAFDPYLNGFPNFGWLKLVGIMLLSFTLLPSPDVRTWGETHSLNGPCWSLLQEYIANIIYALAGRRMNKLSLWILVIISGGVLVGVSIWRNDVATGWSFETFWIGMVRMMFPFFAGLLLFRSTKLFKIKHAYILCSLALIALFCLPHFGKYNGLYEAACIIIAFPLIVAAGASGQVEGKWAKLCKFSGDISYPIYILHYPFIYLYIGWIAKMKPETSQMVYIGAALFVFFILLAYAALKFYDEPIRNWLKQKLMQKKEQVIALN